MTDSITRISKLEEQVGELIELCQRLDNDNKDLRTQLQRLTSERSTLMEQKEKIRLGRIHDYAFTLDGKSLIVLLAVKSIDYDTKTEVEPLEQT